VGDSGAGADGGSGTIRPRVMSLLSAAWQRRTTLVVAGGGYGKSTALRDVAAMGASSWVTIRPADGLIETLSARLAAALGAPLPEDQSALAGATGADDRRGLAERHAALLCERAEQRPGELLLVLDDLESAGDDDAVGELLRVLCLEAPPQLHIVLCGRRIPALGLGTARGRGEVLEVAAPDLAFTVAETGRLLAARLGPETTSMAEQCCALTGGWAAALQLLVDRLDRLAPGDRARALDRLGRHRPQLWRNFADELVSGEPARTRRILAVAWAARRVSARLLDAVGVPGAANDLDSLTQRGLLVEASDQDAFALSPVLADSAAGQLAEPEASALRETVARWFEDQHLLEEALECRSGGPAAEARAFMARCGPALVRRGGAARLADVLRRHGTGADSALDAVLAEALQAIGDWDGAIELFARLQRSAGQQGLPPAVAWRFGVVQYLRGQSASALQTLSAAYSPELVSADDAMVSAFLSTTLWSRGDIDAAADLAQVALWQAEASGDSCARAAAFVSVALVAAGRGQRERNEQAYRAALAAATEAGDRVQLARIHANLSSRALEEGDYGRAVQEAGLALSTGASHRFFAALALSNKAEAHLRLGEFDEARGALSESLEAYAALGSLDAAVPQHLLAELYRQTGNLARARSAFERARDLAEESGDTHTQVHVLCGLARTLAADDLDAARRAAAAAVARATSLERAAALCASAEIELWAGADDQARAIAERAEAEARQTQDRAALAEALELRGAASVPPGLEQLAAAVELWEDVGNPVAATRARLALATERGQPAEVRDARRRLDELGVPVGIGAAGLLAARRDAGTKVSIAPLGRFSVIRGGEHVALTAWQSRKARDLLKLLVARRGRPVSREAAAGALWPEQDHEPLGNRLSVALSTIRKVLDPGRSRPADYYLLADGQSIALRLDHVSVDVMEFLDTATAAITLASGEGPAAAGPVLQRAWGLYAGDFLEDDPYADWAVECREEARSAALMVLRLLARLAVARGSDEVASQHLGQLLERDPYDEDAWLALVAAQLRLRRHGEARRRYAAYARRMAELDVAPVPLAETAGRRP
jgi:ATP/maltotriose-dependent transcriptional regulator MalT/DNA-binding SARP family transcriptional activator